MLPTFGTSLFLWPCAYFYCCLFKKAYITFYPSWFATPLLLILQVLWHSTIANSYVFVRKNSSSSPCIRNPRPQCARQSKMCYPVNHLPFRWKRCISVRKWSCCRSTLLKDASKVFFREVNTNKYIINTILMSSYTWFENIMLNSSENS